LSPLAQRAGASAPADAPQYFDMRSAGLTAPPALQELRHARDTRILERRRQARDTFEPERLRIHAGDAYPARQHAWCMAKKGDIAASDS
jgi:hypothetical protein